MTNKIIIDGIDVSECDRYIDYTGFTGVYNTPVEEGQCRMPTIHRCEGSECIYKKYKRKKQECEEWKHQAELGSDTTDRLTKDIERLLEENEKLKSQLNNNQQEDDRGYCETYDCKYYNNLEECQKQNCWYKNYSKEHTKNVQLKKQLQAKEQECENYKQALDEIERICKYKQERSEYVLPSVFNQILDIINKTDCRQSAKCFCKAKHADTFNADNQAAKEQ